MDNLIYLILEKRQSVKKDGKESKTPRYVLIRQAGYYKPLQAIKNAKGEIVFYLLGTDGIINANDRRRADVWLQSKEMNFSSIYRLDLDTENIVGYGNPADAKLFKPKRIKGKDGKIKVVERANPFFENRGDGFLFIINPDYSVIEIIIVPNGKYHIQSIAKKYADGKMDEELNTLRKAAQSKNGGEIPI
jgi:hypothetical protein